MSDHRPCWLKVLDGLPGHVEANLGHCVKCAVNCLIGSIPDQFPSGLDETAYATPRELVLAKIRDLRVDSAHTSIRVELDRLVKYLEYARCGEPRCQSCEECLVTAGRQ